MENIKAFNISGVNHKVSDLDAVLKVKNTVTESGTYNGEAIVPGATFMDSDGILKKYSPAGSSTISSITDTQQNISGFTYSSMNPQCAYGNGKYVTAEMDQMDTMKVIIGTSDDGITFTEHNDFPTEEYSFTLLFVKDAFFICGTSLYRSVDGVTWTAVISDGTGQVFWDGTRFYATTWNNGLQVSLDGITWTSFAGSPSRLSGEGLFVNSNGNIWIPNGSCYQDVYDPLTGWVHNRFVNGDAILGCGMIGDTFTALIMCDVSDQEYYQALATTYSTDGGHTWSTPVPLGSIENWDIFNLQGYGGKALLHMDGYLLIRLNAGSSSATWLYTTDGITWTTYAASSTYITSLPAVKDGNTVWNCDCMQKAYTSTVTGIVPASLKPALGNPPSTNGTYQLTLTVNNGDSVISWGSGGGGGSSYTAGTGIDITNDVISVTAPTLTNTATGTSTLTVGGTASTGTQGTNVGIQATAGNYSTSLGYNARSATTGGTALGYNAAAFTSYSTSLGAGSQTSAANCIALGAGARNGEAKTFKVALGNSGTAATDESSGLYTLLNSSGKVPVGRYINMSGASSSDAGSAGAVPAPVAGDQGKFLRGDGTWQAAQYVPDYDNPTASAVSLTSGDNTVTLTEASYVLARTPSVSTTSGYIKIQTTSGNLIDIQYVDGGTAKQLSASAVLGPGSYVVNVTGAGTYWVYPLKGVV